MGKARGDGTRPSGGSRKAGPRAVVVASRKAGPRAATASRNGGESAAVAGAPRPAVRRSLAPNPRRTKVERTTFNPRVVSLLAFQYFY